MATTPNYSNNEVIKWRKQVFREYRRGNLFSPYMGEGPTSIIQTFSELKDGGDQLNIPLIGRLKGPGVGVGPLVGNEEKLDSYGMRAWVDWARNGVELKKNIQRKSSFDQLEFVRPSLTQWGKELQRDEIILAFDSIPSESPPTGLSVGAGQRVNGILYSVATAAQKNAWHDANSDRVLYGIAKSNFVSGNHASSLANVDSTNDKASAAQLMMMKRMARKADPSISPYMVEEGDGREYFVCFAGSNAFRDYAADATIVAANKDARAREGNGMSKNPLFQDGDLLYRGVIIREVPEIDLLATKTGVGASSINVAPVFFCGQNAIAMPWGQLPRPTERKEDDYGFIIGRGIEMVYGVAKVFRKENATSGGTNLKQWGMLTAYVSSVDDA